MANISEIIQINDEKLNPLSYIAAAIILIISVLPFFIDYKSDDFHQSWLNHDYNINLMSSTEENSVYMTEGGDNQVFGSLYFMYAEKRRPDISPYDQMGNIFKRIYGDMRIPMSAETLSRRKNLVDAHIFAGEEPFYRDIESTVEPYFIPYWQGRRPVYLTWERPNPWTLRLDNFGENGTYIRYDTDQKKFIDTGEQYGDYYYKLYGIMYRVQPIEYEIVDYLEIKKTVPITEIQSQLSLWLHRSVDIPFTFDKISKMTAAGFISSDGTSVSFVKMYPAPHSVDYYSKMLTRWKNIPNAPYYDMLTRTIILDYDYQLGEIYRNEITKLREIRSNETRPERIADIDARIKENWEKAKGFYFDSLKYGQDSISCLQNTSIVFFNNGIEDLDSLAHDLLAKAIIQYSTSWSTYSAMFEYLINDSMKNPSHEIDNISQIDYYFALLKQSMAKYKSAKGSYAGNPDWHSFGQIENYVNQVMKKTPSTRIAPDIELLENELKTDPSKIDISQAESLIAIMYEKAFPFQFKPYLQKADYFFNTLYNMKKSDLNFVKWAFGITVSYQMMDRIYKIGKDMEILGPVNSNPAFYYTMGIASYNLGYHQEAKSYMQIFLDQVKNDRNAQVQLRDPISQAQKLLSIVQ